MRTWERKRDAFRLVVGFSPQQVVGSTLQDRVGRELGACRRVARHSQRGRRLMNVKMWLCALLIAGCHLDQDTQDDRPATFEFITEAILKPSCGTAECHSAMKAEKQDVFDSVEGARTTFTITH